MENFLIIAITSENYYPNESERINSILTSGEADRVHLRKPDWSQEEIETLINEINPELWDRIVLHDHFELVEKYPIGGIHLNSRNPIKLEGARSVSKSLHSLEEIETANNFDYFFISPVFDSISKPGYKTKFQLKELERKIKGKKAIALGGVTPEKFPLLKEAGFYGAALLGHFFPQPKDN